MKKSKSIYELGYLVIILFKIYLIFINMMIRKILWPINLKQSQYK